MISLWRPDTEIIFFSFHYWLIFQKLGSALCVKRFISFLSISGLYIQSNDSKRVTFFIVRKSSDINKRCILKSDDDLNKTKDFSNNQDRKC